MTTFAVGLDFTFRDIIVYDENFFYTLSKVSSTINFPYVWKYELICIDREWLVERYDINIEDWDALLALDTEMFCFMKGKS